MNIKLISFILLLVFAVIVKGHTEEDDQYRTKIKASVKGTLRTIGKFVKSAEKFAAKMFDKFVLKTSLKAGEKLTMKTSEKIAVKMVEKVATKGTVKFAGKTAGKLVKRLSYLNIVAGLGFGLWRIIDDPEDWQSYALAAGEVTSGLVSIVPGIGTYASTAIDAGLLAFDLKYAKHEHSTHEEHEQAQQETEQISEASEQIQVEPENTQETSEQVQQEPEQTQEEIDYKSEL